MMHKDNEYILHIESTETDEGQMLKVRANGVISGIGKLTLAVKALEALDIDDYLIPVLFRAYELRDEMPQTVINLSNLPGND